MFGWQAPWPFQWGGGPTPIDQALNALLAGVGKGHAADVDGVEWRWREARAIGIASAMTMGERALMQFSPGTATSAIQFYEELFSLYGFSEQQIRDRATVLSNASGDVGVGELELQLQAIDPGFSIIANDWDTASTTVHGSAFESEDLSFNFADGRGESLYPNVSSAFVIQVAYDLDGSPPTSYSSQNAMSAARALLDDALPAWVDYEIGGTPGGFILDSSFLDWDRFDP
jgi:hypothetical protein